MLCFLFRHNFNKSMCKNIYFVSLNSPPSPLVRIPHQLTPYPSPNTFRLCPFLSSSPSTASPFARKTTYNAFNTITRSSKVLAEEGVPIFDYHIRLIPMVIYFGVDNLKQIILSSSLVPSPSKKFSRRNKNTRGARCLYWGYYLKARVWGYCLQGVQHKVSHPEIH